MYFKTSYDSDFDDLYMHLKAKYSDAMFDIDGIGKQLDMNYFSKNFFSAKVTADASVDANANVSSNSVIAYDIELPKPFMKINSYYVLWKKMKALYGLDYANKAIEDAFCGDVYIHDMHGIGSGKSYCYNYSTYDILTKGLCMASKVKSKPPKHLHAFKSQLEQFVIISSNSTLGATGLADTLICMSYFVKKMLKTKEDMHVHFATEEDCWVYAKEMIDSFVYSINFDLRANQSPFTNFSVYDKYFLESLCEEYVFPDGSSPDIEIVQRLQKIYLDVMNEELSRVPITFPVTTACFAVDENRDIKDKEFLRYISEVNMKYGFINFYCGDSATLSSCCRLRSNRKNEYFNSFGSGSTKIGSLGVVTLNLPRIAYKAKGDKEKFFEELTRLVELCAKINNAKRKVIKERIENGNEPLYTYDFMSLNKQYSTCGVNGLNEAITEMGYDILTEDGQDFVLEIINKINKENDKYEKQYSAPHNCEQVPSENMAVKAATKDRLLKYQNKYNLYSNQFIPLTINADLLDRIMLQGKFDAQFSGGAICHLNVETKITDEQKMYDLVEKAAKMGCIYFAVNYVLGECENGHFTVTKNESCEICGGHIVDFYTRVVGFLTNVKNWNKVRREEDFPNRQFYDGEDI